MKVNEIIEDLKFCKGIFDYTIAPNYIEKLVNYIEQLQQENQQLKEEINKISKKELKVRDMLYSIEKWDFNKRKIKSNRRSII